MPAADVPDRFAGPHVPASSIDFSLPAVLATMALVLIVLGAFLEPVGIMMLTIPVFMPLVQSYGVDPLWMGVFILIFIELGLATPPFGLALYVMLASAPGKSIIDLTRAVAPYLACSLLLVVLITLVPDIVLFQPSLAAR